MSRAEAQPKANDLGYQPFTQDGVRPHVATDGGGQESINGILGEFRDQRRRLYFLQMGVETLDLDGVLIWAWVPGKDPTTAIGRLNFQEISCDEEVLSKKV
jgi:hypothetical protein